MRTSPLLAAALLGLAFTRGLAQPDQVTFGTIGPADKPPELTRFNLDFPGGTPKELVAAIQKALGRPLNAIVPDEFSDVQLPALKMTSVNASQLFQALGEASRKITPGAPPGAPWVGGSYQTSYGFRQSPGSLSDDTIWYFYVEKPASPPTPAVAKVCRFYQLTPYLDRHLTVDDITTAIETGWKMLGEPSPPTISFHKDTKLLIAVGEPGKLEIIDAALKALDVPKPAPAAAGRTPAPKPAEPAKSQE